MCIPSRCADNFCALGLQTKLVPEPSGPWACGQFSRAAYRNKPLPPRPKVPGGQRRNDQTKNGSTGSFWPPTTA